MLQGSILTLLIDMQSIPLHAFQSGGVELVFTIPVSTDLLVLSPPQHAHSMYALR